MKKYAHLYEISKEVKTEIEDACGSYISPLNYDQPDVKEAIIKALDLDIDQSEITVSALIEDNGGRTLVVISSFPLDGYVEVFYRYTPEKSHTLADWLFYVEDMCVAFEVPRTILMEADAPGEYPNGEHICTDGKRKPYVGVLCSTCMGHGKDTHGVG